MTTIPTPYYGGGQVSNPADVIQTSGAPSTALINLGLGTLAVDNSAGVIYGLVSKGGGSASWVVLGGGALSGITTINGNTGSVTGTTVSIIGANAGAPLAFAGSGTTLTGTITPGTILVSTLTGSTGGGAISPTAGNIALTAGTGITITGSGSTITFDAGGAVGVTQLSASTGGAVFPSGGNINILGDGGQITTTASTNSITVGLPTAILAPGSLQTVTSITSGTTMTANTGATILGGDLRVNVGDLHVILGDVDVTNGSVSAGNNITTLNNITATTGNITASSGLVSGVGLTSLVSPITAVNGDLILSTAGNKIEIATGANASCGTSGAMTSGSIVISTTAVTASSLIFLTPNALGTVTTPKELYVSARTPGTSFTITSADATDTSTVNWFFIN